MPNLVINNYATENTSIAHGIAEIYINDILLYRFGRVAFASINTNTGDNIKIVVIPDSGYTCIINNSDICTYSTIIGTTDITSNITYKEKTGMIANPIIKALSITINPTTGEVYQQRLYQNTGTYGWARGRTVKKNGTTIFQNSVCINPTTGLSIRGYSPIVPAPLIVVGELIDHIMFGCNSLTEQNCASVPVTCTNPIESSRLTDIPVATYDPSVPSAPSNLIATPGDTIADISFSSAAPGNSSDGARIFAYHVVITDPSGVTIINGYLTSLENSIRIGNLTNGIVYNVAITTFTVSGMTGTRAMATVTPEAPIPPVQCPTPSVSIAMVQG